MAYSKEREERLRALLENYFEGGTSLQEEKELRGYFTSGEEIPADMEYARVMFGYFGDAASEKPEREFTMPAGEREYTLPVEGKPARTRTANTRRRTRRLWTLVGSAAAAVIVAVALTTTLKTEEPAGDTVYCYIDGVPITDYDLAYAYTQGALGLIEDNLKKPGEYLVPVSEMELALESLRYLELLGVFTDEECQTANQ